MKKLHCWIMIIAFSILPIATTAHCEVDWSPGTILSVKSSPIATALTPDGKWTFVLTTNKKINIYDQAGTLNDTIPVTPDIDQIAVTANGEMLVI